METYEVIFNEGTDKGVYALSVVENPAMEGEFIALNKHEEIKLAEVDREQRILMGVALIPDKLIYRNQGGKEFNITFSSDTIKKIAHAFLKNGYQGNSTIEHENKINGVSVVESWIIDDEKHDKSRAYGFDYPKGSWMATMKVDNEELWQDYVKTGKIKGFSIDGLFRLEKIKLSDMSETKSNILTELASAIKALLSTEKADEEVKVQLGEVVLDNGSTITFEGDTLEVGKEVFIKDDEENVPLPNGDYATEDGFLFSVVDGVVTGRVQEEVQEELESQEVDVKKVLSDLITKLSADFDEKIESLKVEFSKQIEEKDEVIKSLETKLSETPASEPIKQKVELKDDYQPRTKQERILQTILNQK